MSVIIEKLSGITPEQIQGKAIGLTLKGQYTLMAASVLGCSFRDMLSSARSWPCTALYAGFVGACRIVAAAHQDGMLHQNLTPENIFIDGSEAIFVAGWSKGEEAQTTFGSGTPGYSSPEQIKQDKGAIDERSDLFALGVIFYEILTGQRPFEGKSTIEVIAATLERHPDAIRSLSPKCPAALAELCERLLDKNPTHRPVSVSALLETLQPIIEKQETTPTRELATHASGNETVAEGLGSTLHALAAGPVLPSQRPVMEEGSSLQVVPPLMYEVRGELARGGLGKISVARDTRLDRPVALKEIIKNNPEAQERFLREAMVTARLQHPGIVPIYEAGRWPSGGFFYSMRLVSGKPLNRVIQMTKTLQERLGLLPHLVDVSEAIAYAHSQKIIHRDLKPQNILVGEFGETIVIDWGLAKDLSNKDGSGVREPNQSTAEDGLTQMGTVIGTPAYMPPEQARGEAVDERADVYALGSILYFLLAGAPPYQGGSPADVIQQVLLRPPKPLEEHQPEAPRDLLAIVQKAMRRDPAQRYPTAREFLDDVKRFQTGQLVGVYRYTTSELLSRWLQKNRALVSVAGILLFLLLGTGAYSFWSVVEEKNRALAAEQTAEREKKKALAKEEEARWLQAVAEEARDSAEKNNNDLALLNAANLMKDDPAFAVAWLKKMTLEGPGWGFARIIAEEALHRALSKDVFRGHAGIVEDLSYSPDGNYLLSASRDKTIRIWSLKNEKSFILKGHEEAVLVARASPTNKTLASGSEDKTIRIWSLETGKELKRLEGHKAAVRALSYSPDGAKLVSVDDDGGVLLWSLPEGSSKELSMPGGKVQSAEFSPDGKRLAYTTKDLVIHLWDTSTLKESAIQTALPPIEERSFLHFSPDSKFIALTAGGHLQLWDVSKPDESTKKWSTEENGLSHITAFAVSPDGKLFATGHEDASIRFWRWETNEQRVLHGHTAKIRALHFSPDGARLASAADDKLVIFWDVATGASHTYKGHAAPVKDLVFSPNGTKIASVCDYNVIRQWSAEEGEPLEAKALDSTGTSIERFVLSGDGTLLAATGTDHSIWLFILSALTPSGRVLVTESGQINAIAISPDGRKIVSSTDDKLIHVWETTINSEHPTTLSKHTSTIRALAFSADGSLLASGSDDKTIILWNTSSGSPEKWDIAATLSGHAKAVTCVQFSPDKKLLLSGDKEGTVIVWDVEKQEKKFTLRNEHLDSVTSVAFYQDATKTLLLSTSQDKTLHLCELRTCTQEKSLQMSGHTDAVLAAVFSKDGSQVISTGADHSVIYWDTYTGRGMARQGYDSNGRSLVLLHNDKESTENAQLIVADSKKGALLLWPQETLSSSLADLPEKLSTLTTADIDPNLKPSTKTKYTNEQ